MLKGVDMLADAVQVTLGEFSAFSLNFAFLSVFLRALSSR